MKSSFNTIIYGDNKAIQLNTSGEAHHGVEAGQWTRQEFERVLREIGWTYMQHYQLVGMHEYIVPYAFWDERTYLENKCYLLNKTGESHSGIATGKWTPENLKQILFLYGFNPLSHYELHGQYEGVTFWRKDEYAPTTIEDETLFNYYGSTSCIFLKDYLVPILHGVIKSLHDDNPLMPKLIAGDACLSSGQKCPNHLTHFNLNMIDFDYPLYSGKATQYGNDIEEIWIKNDPNNMILDESKINWWVIYEFLIRLKKAIEAYHNKSIQTQFIIHQKIFDLISKNLSTIDANNFRILVRRDEGHQFNHHTHMHLRLEGT